MRLSEVLQRGGEVLLKPGSPVFLRELWRNRLALVPALSSVSHHGSPLAFLLKTPGIFCVFGLFLRQLGLIGPKPTSNGTSELLRCRTDSEVCLKLSVVGDVSRRFWTLEKLGSVLVLICTGSRNQCQIVAQHLQTRLVWIYFTV